jgi:hypothetical protein
VTEGQRKLHNEEIRNFYSLSSLIRVVRSRRKRWAWNVAQMGKRGMHIGYCVSTVEEILGRKSSGSGLENRDYARKNPPR